MKQLTPANDEATRKDLVNFILYKAGHLIDEETEHRFIKYLVKQKEIPMPNSTELIEMWNNEKAMLKEKDFQDDAWRLAQNSFMDGFARGIYVKTKKQKEQKEPFSCSHENGGLKAKEESK